MLKSMKVGILAVAVSSALLLSGCSSSGSGSSATAASAGPAQPGAFCGPTCKAALALKVNPDTITGKVGLSLNDTSFSYGVAMRNQAEEEVRKYFPKMQLTVTDGQGNAAKQSNDVDNLVASGIKVLLISPYEADALVPAIRRAEAAGVKVVTVDRNANTSVTSYIASNDVDNGKAVGTWMAKQLHGKGKILEITGTPGASPTIARHDGFMEGIKPYPGIKVIASENGDYLKAPALTAMQNLLQRYPAGSFQAVYVQSDDMAVGVIQAIQEANRKGIIVGSINGEQIGMDAIKKGQLGATAVYAVVSREGVMAAAKLLAGETLPKHIWMTSTLVTKDNVAKYNGQGY